MAHFAITSHVLTGPSALFESKPYLSGLGTKALIVTGPHVGKSPMMDGLKKFLTDLRIDYVVYDGITGEPTVPMIDEGTERFKKEGCDFLIGLGGGSPLDSAKAIAAMAVNPGKISDYAGKEITGKIPGIVAIPTTSGTGSETTKFTVISDPVTDVKMLLRGDVLVPDVAILNPAYTVDMPRKVTACTGLDALTHAIEAYTSVKAMELTDIFALSAVRRIMTWLPKAFDNGYDEKARSQMELAAFEAGVCINNSSVTIVHGMSRPIGALYHVPHGMSNAMLLDVCLHFALDGTPERFADLGRAVGIPEEEDAVCGEKFLRKVSELAAYCRIPTIEEYGIDPAVFRESIPKMAKDAVASGSPGNTRKPVTEEDCMALYEKLLS